MPNQSKKNLPVGYDGLKKDISSIIEKSNIKTYQALSSIIINTLLETGRVFSFLGRKRKIIIDGQTNIVDLEFYNRELQCILLVELKTEKFKAEFVGQMNKYISYYRENIQLPHERDTIGLIVCAEKGKEEVYYAVDGLDYRIFVEEYKTKLPSEEEIKRKLEQFPK